MQSYGGVVRNLPKAPAREWPLIPAPECLVFDGKEWERVQLASMRALDRLSTLTAVEVPTVTADATRLGDALRQGQKELATLEVVAARSLQDNAVEEAQNASIRERIDALEADLRHYQDLKRLRDIGAELKLSVVTDGVQPVSRKLMMFCSRKRRQRHQCRSTKISNSYLGRYPRSLRC